MPSSSTKMGKFVLETEPSCWISGKKKMRYVIQHNPEKKKKWEENNCTVKAR